MSEYKCDLCGGPSDTPVHRHEATCLGYSRAEIARLLLVCEDKERHLDAYRQAADEDRAHLQEALEAEEEAQSVAADRGSEILRLRTAIEQVLPGLDELAAQIICPQDNTFRRMSRTLRAALPLRAAEEER
jgi:hypothetical protein